MPSTKDIPRGAAYGTPIQATHHQQINDLRDEGSDASGAYRLGGSASGLNDFVRRNNGLASAASSRVPVQLDGANQLQSRGLQMAAANGYRGMVSGTGPSLAGFAQNQANASAAGQAMAGMSRGGPAAGIQAINSANMGASQATDAAVGQRLSEFNTGVGGLGAVAKSMYEQDASFNNSNINAGLDSRQLNDNLAFGYDQRSARGREVEMNAQADRDALRNQMTEGQLAYDTQMTQLNNEKKDAELQRYINTIKLPLQAYGMMYGNTSSVDTTQKLLKE